jgi:xylulokinase
MTRRPTDTVVGIDLGTSVVKAGIYTLDGEVLGSGSCPVALHHGPDGRVEQDLDEFYAAAAAATRDCLDAASRTSGVEMRDRVRAVAMAGQMAGVGLVDQHHRPVAPYDSWLDARCGEVAAELVATLGDRITRTAGCAPTISIGPKMLWWRRNHPDVCERAASFVTAAGYVAGRAAGLEGKEAFIDPTYLHFTCVANLARGSWDEELVREVGLDVHLLPRVVECSTMVGTLTERAAEDFGLPIWTPIAAGCGDTAASALGAGVQETGHAFDIAGTAAVLGVCLETFVPDTAHGTLMTMRAALPGRWYSLAYVGGAGQLVEWVCREMLGRDELDTDAYAFMGEAVSRVPAASDGVLVFPHFLGRVAPAAAAAKGTVIGLTPTTGRAHVARAALESIAYEYRSYVDVVRSAVGPDAIVDVVAVGGGSRLAVWNEIKADVLGLPYRPVGPDLEVGTRGAAVVAIAALGAPIPEAGNLAGAASMPNPAHGQAYTHAYERYRLWAEVLVDAYSSAPRGAGRGTGDS